ncbi:MAG: GNAT family N-acetyltransferase [Flavobacteriales bacterium]|nr:GNAT family N-acetyltransferase [Flavobacteriales bacterium]
MIKHLRHNEIDKGAWDARLMRSANRLWYAQSWVLDLACPDWEALVDEEADAMMPLTVRSKWGLPYLYQPLGIQQLGVFAAHPGRVSPEAFIAALPKRIRYMDILVNGSMLHSGIATTEAVPQQNQELVATDALDTLRSHYSKGHRRNLKDAADLHEIALPVSAFETLFRRTTGERFGPSSVKGLEVFLSVVSEGIARGQCEVRALAKDQEPMAAACFATWQGRSIMLKSANSESGHSAKAMFVLIDAWIARHAGTGMLLDFAGSNTPSVARFNAGFGAGPRTYFRLRRNRLPLPLRWLKQ